jgi:hypothetical protein
VVAAAAISVILFRATWSSSTAAIAGAGKDPFLYTWFLEWTPFAITHGHNPLVSDYMAYPHQINLMWNTSMEFLGVLLWPITASAGPLAAYNLAMIAAPVVTGAVAFLALRRHVSATGAVVGAVFYAFSPELVARENQHLVLALAFFPPLAWLLLEVIFTASRISSRLLAGLGLGLASFVELMIEPEMLIIAGIGIGVGAVYVVLLNYGALFSRLAWSLASLAISLGVFLGLGSVPLWIMISGPGRPTLPVRPPNVYVQDLAGLIIPGPSQALTVPISRIYFKFTAPAVESAGYFGPALIVALILVGIFGWRFMRVRWACLMTITMAVLALGPQIHWEGRLTGITLPWAFLQRLPFLDSLLPNRLMITCFLPVALLLAFAVDSLRTAPRRWIGLAGGLGLMVVAITLLPAPYTAQSVYGPGFFRVGRCQSDCLGKPYLDTSHVASGVRDDLAG